MTLSLVRASREEGLGAGGWGGGWGGGGGGGERRRTLTSVAD